MTLTVKLLLIATLILSIIIPFGYYLLGEQSKKRYKKAIGANVFFFFGEFGENKPLDSVEINGKMIGNRKIFKQEYKKSGEYLYFFLYASV